MGPPANALSGGTSCTSRRTSRSQPLDSSIISSAKRHQPAGPAAHATSRYPQKCVSASLVKRSSNESALTFSGALCFVPGKAVPLKGPSCRNWPPSSSHESRTTSCPRSVRVNGWKAT